MTLKKLIIIRHAKSSWDQPELDDFERPLNHRGKKNAPEMGKRLAKSGIQPSLILSSPAERALSTARAVATATGYPVSDIATEFDLYLTGASAMLRVLRQQSDSHDSIALFGHNEGITDFANMLCSYYIDNLPTAGVMGIRFPVSSWSDIDAESGTFCFYDYPRNKAFRAYSF